MRLLILLLLSVISVAAHAADAPEKVLEKFNNAVKAEDAAHYTAGAFKAQFVTRKKDANEKALDALRMKNYRAEVRPVNDTLVFVYVSDIVHVEGLRQENPVTYEFIKVENEWKIASRSSGDGLILDLFRQSFSPEQFHTESFFQWVGQKALMESAFAYSEVDSNGNIKIIITFYPFALQQRDIEYLKYRVGPAVVDTDKATAITSSLKYPRSEVALVINDRETLLSFCMSGDNFPDSKNKGYHFCMPKNPFIEKFSIQQNQLTLVTRGSMKFNRKELEWDINMHSIPLLPRGMH